MAKVILLSKWTGLLLGLMFGGSLMFQAWQLYRFVNQGPRFTAHDGQALCERVAELEKHSIGFQQSGIVSPPCRFARGNP